MKFLLTTKLRKLSTSMAITKENWENGSQNISLNPLQNIRFSKLESTRYVSECWNPALSLKRY